MPEIMWSEIPGFPRYRVSEYGHVHNTESGKFINGSLNGNGRYPAVVLYRGDGTRAQKFTHRLVAEQFVPVRSGKPEVNHIDGNKQNSHASNLEWVGRRENVHHAVRSGLVSKLSSGQVLDARNRRGRGESVVAIAEDLGVSDTTVYRATDWGHWRGGPASKIHLEHHKSKGE